MKKGFTLIELLIVIGILAILATTVVLVLNPATILEETRDTQRISDMGTLQSALSLYLATFSSPDLDSSGFAQCISGTADCVCGTDWWADSPLLGNTLDPFTTGTALSSADNTGSVRNVDGSGWVPVNLGDISGGTPLSVLPTDPNQDVTVALDAGGQYYAYTCSTNNTWEMNANMESAKFSSGADNVEDSDGGNEPLIYEVGNEPGLSL